MLLIKRKWIYFDDLFILLDQELEEILGWLHLLKCLLLFSVSRDSIRNIFIFWTVDWKTRYLKCPLGILGGCNRHNLLSSDILQTKLWEISLNSMCMHPCVCFCIRLCEMRPIEKSALSTRLNMCCLWQWHHYCDGSKLLMNSATKLHAAAAPRHSRMTEPMICHLSNNIYTTGGLPSHRVSWKCHVLVVICQIPATLSGMCTQATKTILLSNAARYPPLSYSFVKISMLFFCDVSVLMFVYNLSQYFFSGLARGNYLKRDN